VFNATLASRPGLLANPETPKRSAFITDRGAIARDRALHSCIATNKREHRILVRAEREPIWSLTLPARRDCLVDPMRGDVRPAVERRKLCPRDRQAKISVPLSFQLGKIG
jgi:hypothetical protein